MLSMPSCFKSQTASKTQRSAFVMKTKSESKIVFPCLETPKQQIIEQCKKSCNFTKTIIENEIKIFTFYDFKKKSKYPTLILFKILPEQENDDKLISKKVEFGPLCQAMTMINLPSKYFYSY